MIINYHVDHLLESIKVKITSFTSVEITFITIVMSTLYSQEYINESVENRIMHNFTRRSES